MMALSKRPAAGFSLVEVLVAIIVLSVGLLGATSMLMTSLRSTNESGSFTAAVNLVRELSEKARANKNASARNADANPYLLDLKSSDPLPREGTPCVGADARCKVEDLAAWDVHYWADRARSNLPGAHLVICFDDDPMSDGDDYHWDCTRTGRNLVVKLGWQPRLGAPLESDPKSPPPRVVMQLVPGQAYDGSQGS